MHMGDEGIAPVRHCCRGVSAIYTLESILWKSIFLGGWRDSLELQRFAEILTLLTIPVLLPL